MPHTITRAWLTALLLVAATSFAQAGAPMAKGQAPGWYRMPLGAFEITALSDGTFEMKPEELLTHTSKSKVAAALAKEHLHSPIDASVNAFLVNTGSKLVLVDAGAAGLFGPSLGKLLANLKAAGYAPEQVDEIVITHMHVDHVGGLTAADGKAVFANATVRAHAKEGAFWLDPATLEKAPAGMKDFVKGAMVSLKPYVDAGRYKPFDKDTELVPGVRAIATPGHGAVSRPLGDDPVRRRLEGRDAAAPQGLRRCGQGRPPGRRGPHRLPRHRPRSCRRQGLPLPAGQLQQRRHEVRPRAWRACTSPTSSAPSTGGANVRPRPTASRPAPKCARWPRCMR